MVLFLEEADEHLNSFALDIIVPHCGLVLGLALVQHDSIEHQSLTLEAKVAECLRKFLFLVGQIHLFSKVLYSRKILTYLIK